MWWSRQGSQGWRHGSELEVQTAFAEDLSLAPSTLLWGLPSLKLMCLYLFVIPEFGR